MLVCALVLLLTSVLSGGLGLLTLSRLRKGVTVMTAGPAVLASQSLEILDYFGRCPRCHYPARAYLVTTVFADGKHAVATLATCDLTCGWSGPAPLTTMTLAPRPKKPAPQRESIIAARRVAPRPPR